ncbi:hypothetical protein [Brotaphodocola sp.]|uniref:hypothetical protein n=1 Tax=Brotaphodocola sp. TaxID=3073577 RepID=UPI003D7E0ED8
MRKNKMRLMAAGCVMMLAVSVTGCAKRCDVKETAVVETETKTSEVTANEAAKPEHASGTTASSPAETTGNCGSESDVSEENFCISGPVLSVENGQITMDNQSGNSYEGEVVLTVDTDTTVIVDGEQGLPVDLSEIKVGDTIYAYIGPAMTMSLPPQTNAEFIVCKVPADSKAPEYVKVKSMEENKDESWTLVSDAGMTYQIAADCPIQPYLTRQIVKLIDVVDGSRVLIWSDAQNQAQKLVLFNE